MPRNAEPPFKVKVKALREATSFAVFLTRGSNKLRVSTSFFLAVHEKLLFYNEKARGRFRKATDVIEIPEGTFVPTESWQIEQKIIDLSEIISNKRKWWPIFRDKILNQLSDKDDYAENDLRSLYKIFIAWYVHHQIVLIHPFCDGNGRIARLMMCMLLRENGMAKMAYPPLINSIICKNKNEYLDCLNSADKGNFITGLNYMVKVMSEAYKEFSKLLK